MAQVRESTPLSRGRSLFSVLVVAILVLSMAHASAAVAPGPRVERLDTTTSLAPVQADGLTVGAPTDFLINFGDPDPVVPGLDLAEGATFRLTLPDDFVNTGVRVAGGGEPGCGPPLVIDCSTAVLVQGWPQSPVLPFPDVHWEADTNTFVLTTTADWLANPPSAPGVKTLHLQAFGFRNPDRPGRYPITLEIQPDPSVDRILVAHDTVRIVRRTPSHIGVLSTVNGAPPPPFPNSIHQRANRADGTVDLLTWGLYLWGRDARPLVGVDVSMRNRRVGRIVDEEGRRVGHVRIRAPRGARPALHATPSVATSALLSGQPTGLMLADFTPDPSVSGDYRITFWLRGGARQDMFLSVE